ncbi:MAG: S8 family serine peptidase [Haloglomus sp.]
MQTTSVPRRRLFRLLGAGAVLGAVGTAAASEERYIICTRSRGARREAQRRARSIHRVLDFGAYGSAVGGIFSEEALRGLSRRPDVDYVEVDGRMCAISIDPTATGELANSWGVDRIDAEKTGTSTGTGAKVVILDTAVDYSHPDPDGNFEDPTTVLLGYDYVNDDSDLTDDNGHGTHCAGIAAASGGDGGVVGVAPSAGLWRASTA